MVFNTHLVLLGLILSTVVLLFSLDVFITNFGNADEELNDECSDGKVFIYNRNGQLSSVSVTRKYHENVPVCQILLHANTNHKILAIINYFPRTQQNYESNFLHIGNDKHRPNDLSMTSYRFCNQTVSEEIVSRGNFLWIVYPIATKKNHLRITVTAHEEVICSGGEFQCSPLQCVNSSRLCDRKVDCDNGRDEYCVYNEDSILSEPCFRCGDGTCILPSLPRYHDDWGKPLWYLCDNVEHCLDGTDERPDVCNSAAAGRRDKVMMCHPPGRPENIELRWKTDFLCDNQDCASAEVKQKCNKGEVPKQHNFFIPTLIVAIAVIAVAMAFCIIHKRILLMSKKPPDDNVEGRLPIQNSSAHNRFNLCQVGRPSLDLEEKQCFISTV